MPLNIPTERNIVAQLGIYSAITIPIALGTRLPPSLDQIYGRVCRALNRDPRFDLPLIVKVYTWDERSQFVEYTLTLGANQQPQMLAWESIERLEFHRYLYLRIDRINGQNVESQTCPVDFDSVITEQLGRMHSLKRPGWKESAWGLAVPTKETQRKTVFPDRSLEDSSIGRTDIISGYLPVEPVQFACKSIQYNGIRRTKWMEVGCIFTGADLQLLALEIDVSGLRNSRFSLFEQNPEGEYLPLPTEFSMNSEKEDWHLSRITDISIQYEGKAIREQLPLDLPIRHIKQHLLEKHGGMGSDRRVSETVQKDDLASWHLCYFNPGDTLRSMPIALEDSTTLGQRRMGSETVLYFEQVGNRDLVFLLGEESLYFSMPYRMTLREVLNRELRLPDDPSSIVKIALEIDTSGSCHTTGLLFEVYAAGGNTPIPMDTLVRKLPNGPLTIHVWVWAHVFTFHEGKFITSTGYIPAELPIKKISSHLRKLLKISGDCSVINLSNIQKSFLSWGNSATLSPDTCLLEHGNHLSGLCLLALVPTTQLTRQDWLSV